MWESRRSRPGQPISGAEGTRGVMSPCIAHRACARCCSLSSLSSLSVSVYLLCVFCVCLYLDAARVVDVSGAVLDVVARARAGAAGPPVGRFIGSAGARQLLTVSSPLHFTSPLPSPPATPRHATRRPRLSPRLRA